MTKIDGTPIDDGEHLDLVVPMYNLIEYSSNFSENSRDKFNTRVYGFIQKMKQLILKQILLMIIILNILNMRLNY